MKSTLQLILRLCHHLAPVLIVTLLIVISAPPAWAKGPSQAVIEGPGLSAPLPLRPPGTPTIGPFLADMVEGSGFFPAIVGGTAVRRTKPEGRLGPRYRVTYSLGQGATATEIIQFVYPYADPGPVTYMPSGQPTWDPQETKGGWYSADPSLKDLLLEAGLPEDPPSHRLEPPADAVQTELRIPIRLPVTAVAVALAALLVIVYRRRRRLVH